MHDGMPYGRNQGQGQGHSREVDRQSPTGLILIAVLTGIEICDKLFTPEMVVHALSIHDCESVLGIGEQNMQYRCGLTRHKT